jgi:hypothetical protein
VLYNEPGSKKKNEPLTFMGDKTFPSWGFLPHVLDPVLQDMPLSNVS